jgi:hypothetical protein
LIFPLAIRGAEDRKEVNMRRSAGIVAVLAAIVSELFGAAHAGDFPRPEGTQP